MVQPAGFHFTCGVISMQFKFLLSGQPVATEACVRGGGAVFCFVLKDRDKIPVISNSKELYTKTHVLPDD